MSLRPCADPDDRAREECLLDEDCCARGRRERRDRAGLNTGDCKHLGGLRDAHARTTRRRCDLGHIGTAVAGNEDEHGPLVADEDERLDDLLETTANRLGRRLRRPRLRLELLEAGLRAARSQEYGHAFDGVGPGHRSSLGAVNRGTAEAAS